MEQHEPDGSFRQVFDSRVRDMHPEKHSARCFRHQAPGYWLLARLVAHQTVVLHFCISDCFGGWLMVSADLLQP